MKNVGWFILHSVTLFGTYLLSSSLLLMLLSTLLRTIIPTESFGERLWKAIFLYAAMAVVSALHLDASGAEHKRAYLLATEGVAWNGKTALLFTVKNVDFWLRSAGFLLWSLILPQLFGAINHLYVSSEFLETFPDRVLILATVWIPYLCLHFGAWLVLTRLRHKQRMHG